MHLPSLFVNRMHACFLKKKKNWLETHTHAETHLGPLSAFQTRQQSSENVGGCFYMCQNLMMLLVFL